MPAVPSAVRLWVLKAASWAAERAASWRWSRGRRCLGGGRGRRWRRCREAAQLGGEPRAVIWAVAKAGDLGGAAEGDELGGGEAGEGGGVEGGEVLRAEAERWLAVPRAGELGGS